MPDGGAARTLRAPGAPPPRARLTRRRRSSRPTRRLARHSWRAKVRETRRLRVPRRPETSGSPGAVTRGAVASRRLRRRRRRGAARCGVVGRARAEEGTGSRARRARRHAGAGVFPPRFSSGGRARSASHRRRRGVEERAWTRAREGCAPSRSRRGARARPSPTRGVGVDPPARSRGDEVATRRTSARPPRETGSFAECARRGSRARGRETAVASSRREWTSAPERRGGGDTATRFPGASSSGRHLSAAVKKHCC